MPGAMRKMAVYLGLVEEDHLDQADDDYYERGSSYEDRYPPREVRSVRTVEPQRSEPRNVETRVPRASASRFDDTDALERVSPSRRPTPMPSAVDGLYRITALHPRSYNDARRIGEEFRDGVPVIMNLSDMDDAEAKRLVDFAAGLIFGCRGSIERITNKVFLLSPQNVDVAAEAHRLAQDGFFNQS